MSKRSGELVGQPSQRSQYYGKFEANFSIYIGQMSFHIRRINFICFYIRLYIILILL
jgi:hypothetical protein